MRQKAKGGMEVDIIAPFFCTFMHIKKSSILNSINIQVELNGSWIYILSIINFITQNLCKLVYKCIACFCQYIKKICIYKHVSSMTFENGISKIMTQFCELPFFL